MNISNLKPGDYAEIISVGGSGALRQHFLDMGLIPGENIKLLQFAPMGDPLQIRINDYDLTLRKQEASEIEVQLLDSSAECASTMALKQVKSLHPGLGEEGRYHDKGCETPLPDDRTLRFALVGNQNAGKTTLFNQLTGANQHVGNFPGVTVDRKSGQIRGLKFAELIDLPGIYSLSPYTEEEIVTRKFILDELPEGIINIVDATNIERNLYLTLQLLELDIPMVLALNMMDEVYKNGGSILINEMEQILGIPVVPISAIKNEGIDELIAHAIHVARFQEKPARQDFCDAKDRGGAIHRCIHAVMHLVEDHAESAGIPLRFAASKLASSDPLVTEALRLDSNEKELLEHILVQMENECHLDRNAAIADMRFQFIKRLCSQTVVRPVLESIEHVRSRRIDKFLTGKFTAIPAFILILLTVFYLTFNVFGAWLQGLFSSLINAASSSLEQLMVSLNVNSAITALVIDGVCNGVGSVLSFMPIIVVLFFFLSMLEDTGYLARVAFVMDKPLRRIGLSGRSIVPMLIGFGCSVPAIMASRTLPSARDRKLTILLTPFMSCSAKLPIYGFICQVFFPRWSGLIMASLYLLGIGIGLLLAAISKRTVFKGEAVPFVMELPNYRLPSLGNVMSLLWEKAKDFMQKAFTIIFVASVIIWFLQSFDLHLEMVNNPSSSILARIASLISFVLIPLGLGDYRISTALISGFLAKESVVSTLTILFGSQDALRLALAPDAAMALLVFCLLYTPCIAAVTAVKRELGTKWAIFEIVGQCTIAWIVAFLVRVIL